MSYLVRKVNKAKWLHKNNPPTTFDVCADAITNCLKTYSNTLSVWHIQTPEEINNALLAIISNQDRFDTIDIVILKQADLEELKIDIQVTDGNTCVEKLKKTHRDLANLTFSGLESVKDLIVLGIHDKRIKRVTAAESKKIIEEAITRGDLSPNALKESLREKL